MVTEKKSLVVSNIHSMHTLLKFIGVDQNTVVSGSVMPPGGDCMNTFMAHAACPAYIAWCVEIGDDR